MSASSDCLRKLCVTSLASVVAGNFDMISAADDTDPFPSASATVNRALAIVSEQNGQGFTLAVIAGAGVILSRYSSSGIEYNPVDSANTDATDVVTALLWLPLWPANAQHRYLLVGHKSGHIRVYCDGGGLVLSMRLHNTSITKLKGVFAPVGKSSLLETLLVLHNDAVLVCIEASSFMEIANSSHSRCARCQIITNEPNVDKQEDGSISYHKWLLAGQTSVEDVGLCSGRIACTVLPLSTASKRLVVVGSKPFLALFVLPEQPGILLSSIFMGSLSRATKAVLAFAKSWWGGSSGTSTPEQPSNNIAPATSISTECWMRDDSSRNVESLVPDPDSRMGLCNDKLGRVLLVDMAHFVVVRVWKGYRDTQCGWTLLPTTPARNSANYAAVFYLPRRGLLEIWSPFGQRISAMNTGPRCLLAYDWHPPAPRCYLFNAEGVISEIVIK